MVTRKVRETDPTISDEKARSALGALGLIGEKAIRKVGHLSGINIPNPVSLYAGYFL